MVWSLLCVELFSVTRRSRSDSRYWALALTWLMWPWWVMIPIGDLTDITLAIEDTDDNDDNNDNDNNDDNGDNDVRLVFGMQFSASSSEKFVFAQYLPSNYSPLIYLFSHCSVLKSLYFVWNQLCCGLGAVQPSFRRWLLCIICTFTPDHCQVKLNYCS